MGQRRIGQASLAEALLPAGAGSNRRLERIAGLIDWTPFERLLTPLRAPTGRPGHPPLALFRALTPPPRAHSNVYLVLLCRKFEDLAALS
jgi:IS5 family transposase